MGRVRIDISGVFPIVAVAIAYRSSPGFELVGDATFLIADNAQMRAWSWLPHVLWSDYFEADAGLTIGYWRPWTKASWLVETMLTGGATWVYPTVSAAWLAVAVLGVRALARTLGADRWSATLAACLVAVHPALYEPTSLVMARSDLVCGAGAVWAVVAWLRWRDGGGARWAIAHIAALVLAFGSKETAVILVPLLAGWSILAGDLRGAQRRRLLTVVPVVVVAAGYFTLRAFVVDGGVAAELGPALPRILAGLGIYGRGLLPFTFESGIRNLSYEEAASAAWVLGGVAVTVCCSTIAAASLRAGRIEVAALLAWVAGSLAPVLLVGDLNTPGESGVAHAYSDRWLLQGVLAFGTLAALGIAALRPRLRRPLQVAIAVWVVAAALAGPIAHEPYASETGLLTLEDRDYEATPERFRTAFSTCRYVERAVARELVEQRLDDATALVRLHHVELACPPSLDMDLSLLNGLVVAERWDQALGLVGRFDTMEGWREQYLASLLVGVVYLRAGDAASALPWLDRATDGFEQRCPALASRGQALAALERWGEASTAFEEAFDCFAERGPADAAILRAAANAALRGGDPERAAHLEARTESIRR